MKSDTLHSDGGIDCSYTAILKLALPMVLSMMGNTVMSFFDAVFLARYSEEAVAAMGPAGMGSWMLISLFSGAAGYTSTFVAQYKGAGAPARIGKAVWQGIYFSLMAGLVILVFGTASADRIFRIVGHDPAIAVLEAEYFRITCLAAPAAVLGSALSGFFTGRGEMKTLMVVQIGGQLVNIVLDYAMIFGRLGFPEMGIRGAAIASLVGLVFVAAVLFYLMLAPRHRSELGMWSGRGFDRLLFGRFLSYGMPAGFRFFFEMLAWTAFLFFVGRLGGRELAATNIAWRINIFAFFPIIGLSVAVSTLVGQAQGRGDSATVRRCTWRGLAITQVWMLLWAVTFVTAPGTLTRLFESGDGSLSELVAILLRYVAAYSLLDGINVTVMGALQGAGDTRWTMAASVIMNTGFVAVLATIERLDGGLHGLWIAATIFVMLMALMWIARFMTGRWRGMRVIEVQAPLSAERGDPVKI